MKKYYENTKHNAAFGRCVDIMAQLMLKYGNQVLNKQDDSESAPENESNETQPDSWEPEKVA